MISRKTLTYYISIQGSYSQLELALFQNKKCLDLIKSTAQKASSLLIPKLNDMLQKNNLKISDINFICIDQGPGAFTSLRVSISTINGLAFANKIPLIGIDGLDALSLESLKNYSGSPTPKYLISLLNAYNNEVYFSINEIGKDEKFIPSEKVIQNKGYKKIDILLKELKSICENQLTLFTGNGSILNKDLIQILFQKNSIILNQEVCSTEQIASMAFEKWEQIQRDQNFSYKIYPLYLKSQNFAVRPGINLPHNNASNTSKT